MKKFLLVVSVVIAAVALFALMTISTIDMRQRTELQGGATLQSDANKEEKEEQTPKVTTKTEKKTEVIPYGKKTVNDSSVAEGNTYVSTQGQNGERTITYEVTYTDGKETSRKETSNIITKQPVDQITTVGTKHVYTGYCRVEGTYRNRYARCYGDYRPSAYQQALSQANYCNTSSYPVQGCYNTYY